MRLDPGEYVIADVTAPLLSFSGKILRFTLFTVLYAGALGFFFASPHPALQSFLATMGAPEKFVDIANWEIASVGVWLIFMVFRLLAPMLSARMSTTTITNYRIRCRDAGLFGATTTIPMTDVTFAHARSSKLFIHTTFQDSPVILTPLPKASRIAQAVEDHRPAHTPMSSGYLE